MAANTAISWADDTFNIAIGCQKVSEACAHCYAERDMENPRYGTRFKGAWGTVKRYTLSDTYWKQPLAWNRKAEAEGVRRRVFCSSLCDVFEFHPVLDAERGRLWDLIARTPYLDWLLLTKRPTYAAHVWPWRTIADAPANVWLGTTAENQTWLDVRVPALLDIPARLHFISVEPMLGPLDARPYLGCKTCAVPVVAGDRCPGCYTGAPGVRWVICGGESGPDARPTNPLWVRSLRDQCTPVGVPFHFKQWGEWAPFDGAEGNTPADIHVGADEWLRRVGRKEAGRVLDGQVWDAVPQIAA